MTSLHLPQRQIHLDFHTGPAIPDVGADFDAREFARTMKKAHVNSVTVFAKCHHGHLYFKTKHPARHPGLKKSLDLLGEQVKALHREGIRAPIYISVQCDEFAADTHPEWIARNPDGTAVGAKPLEPGWQILDMSSPYQDYLAEQTEEVLRRFQPVDGIFFDMCWNQPSVGNYAIKGMLRRNYNPEKEGDRHRYSEEMAHEYMARFFRLVRRHAPSATVYFNSRPLSFLPQDLPFLTHVEIEALPTGGWGYLYFPKNVRYARTFDRPYMGMTARFHKSWADFGGLKPCAALKYEVCQMLAHGAQCSIGDQLHPRGTPDAAAYDLIGRVYGYAEACEPWTDNAKPITQIGLFRAGAAGAYHDEPGGTNDGATRMLTHLKMQFDVVQPDTPLAAYDLVILPDSIRLDKDLARSLRSYLRRGGSLLLTGTSGIDEAGRLAVKEMGVTVHGESPFQTTYLRFGDEILASGIRSDHVMYERGLRMTAQKGAHVLARVVEPYFERTGLHFSSHNQTPPLKQASRYAAAIRKGRVITIPFPIFKAFGTHGNLPYRDLVERCIGLLMPDRLVSAAGPSTLEVTVMRQKDRTIVHLLQFVAERRHMLDIVEDIVPLYNVPVSLRLAKRPERVYAAPGGEDLAFEYAEGRVSLTVPKVEGHAMVVLS